MIDKLFKDPKFLSELKRAALNHKDDAIPEKSGEYYQAMMWSKGMLDVLTSRGFIIEKKKDAT